MYATLAINNSKHSGELIGTHQKLDRSARFMMQKYLGKEAQKFPTIDEILRFEGAFGPDGLKRKSPGVDEPEHFIQPDHDDGVLKTYIENHYYNLAHALADGNTVRASFEAAWMAHALTDGLTPAHHFPFRKVVDELMTDHDYVKLMGIEVKGIMRGNSLAQTVRNNWLYIGAGGIMTKHMAYEYGVAYTISSIPYKRLLPKDVKRSDFNDVNYMETFYKALYKVAKMDMYNEFLRTGWNTQLIVETRDFLIPEIIRVIALCWSAALRESERIIEDREEQQSDEV